MSFWVYTQLLVILSVKVVQWANFLFDILIELAEIHNNLKFELDRSSGSKVMTNLVSKLDKIDFLHSFVLYCFFVQNEVFVSYWFFYSLG